MDADGNSEEPSRLVLVRFKTDLGHPYKVPESSISIPANLTRFGLSTVVNNLIKSGNPDWESEPFDFLIKNELVRMSLEKFLLAKNISAERILEIEYIRAVVPRKEEEPSLHNDWVSAVDGSSPRFFLTGCYDGLGRVWKAAGVCTHILEGHSEPVTSVSIINPKGGESVTVATASKDRTLRLWKFNAEETRKNPLKIRAFKILRGHTAAVQSVAAQTSGNMFWKLYIRRPMILVGPSLGGSVAIDFAYHYPVAVEKLVLINASVYAEGTAEMAKLPKAVAYAGVSLLKSTPLRFYANMLAFNGISLATAFDWTNVGRLHCLQPWWKDATVSFMTSGGYNVISHIKHVKQKVLVICSEQDNIISYKQTLRLRCELPFAIMRLIPDTGHLPHVENPASVAKLIAEFARNDRC